MKRHLGVAVGSRVTPDAKYLLGAPLGRAVLEAKEIGYDGIELHMDALEEIDVPALRAETDAAGMRVTAVSTGSVAYREHLCLNSPDGRVRLACMDRVREYIEACAELSGDFSCGLIIANVRGMVPAGFTKEESEDLFAESLLPLDAEAASCGVPLYLELTNRYESDYLNRADETATFLRRFPGLNAKIHLDTFHMNIEEADLCGAIRTAGDLLGFFHVADSNRLPAGEGHMPLAEMFRTLDGIGYAGPVCVECIPLPDGRTAAERSLAWIRRFGE